jgi:hypothetical protein
MFYQGDFFDRNASHVQGKETLAEGVGFEPTVGLPLRLISSQVPLTTQPPFRASRW